LVDAFQPPMVLVEDRKLALPNSGPGNRWVSGWVFDDRPEGLTVRPAAEGPRLEVVHLRQRFRTLFLATRGDASDVEVVAAIQSRGLETTSSPPGIEISLPADLQQGRHLIDLEFAGGDGVAILGATISEAEKKGRVAVVGADVVQHPWSVADFVRRVEPDSVLIGEFVPPVNAGNDQRFALKLGRGEGELETVFEVQPSSGKVVAIRRPLGDVAGLVRVRLVAEGAGQAGRWKDLRVRQREPGPKTAEARPPDPPKRVVVYVLDALRSDFVGHLGSELGATSCIDRLAGEGAVFSNHFSAAPNTGPATTSLFTGFGFLRGRSIPEDVPTLAENSASAGYKTVSISSNPHLSPSFGLTRGFGDVVFDPINEDFEPAGERERTVNDSAERVHRAALAWLDDQDPDDRSFLYLHTLNPHNPYTPPEPFPSKFLRTGDSRIDGSTGTLAAIRDLELPVTSQDVRRIREWYAAAVAYNDAMLCDFVDELERRFGDDFLLVVTSDHGEELFDHDGVLHGHTLYDELLRVPLVMRWPGHISSLRIERATDTLDLTATLWALTANRREVRPAEGTDLWPALVEDRESPDEAALHFATAPGLRRAAMVRSNHWKLVLVPRPRFGWGMGKGRGRTHDAEYLFNLMDDPEERVNLAGASSLEVDWLRSRLEGWVAAWEARQPERREKRLDETTRQRLEALGYTD
jgi:arylsulfatase A-like enzyme